MCIERYLSGTSTPSEKLMLEKYLDSFQKEENEWYEQEMGSKDELQEKIFTAIQRRNRSGEPTGIRKLLSFPGTLRVAAILALFTLLATAVLYFSGVILPPGEIVWNEKTTHPGEKMIVSFIDGSKVTINAESTLRFPQEFGKENREVYLTGEAFFEIAPDSARPFIVYSDKLSTKVLGTAFNVSAFPGDPCITVSLLEGKVQVAGEAMGNDHRTILLQPLQQLVYEKTEKTITVDAFDQEKVIGWKDNSLKFEKETLGTILTALERAYGVNIELSDTTHRSRRYSANFNKTSLITIAEVLKKLTGLRYRKVEEHGELRRIVFFQ